MNQEEGDLDVELQASGPFQMVVEEDENGYEVIVESEEDLIEYMRWRYKGGCFAAVRPVPFSAEHRPGCASNWRELLESQQR